VKPTYQLNNLISDCINGTSKASVIKGALETARSDFNLHTQAQILGFIGNGGLESPNFINYKPWQNNPTPKEQIMVDAYAFYSGSVYGYLAFFFQPTTEKWIIKSFKKNAVPDPRHFQFRTALIKFKEYS
jgi:hypothetical protein